MAIPIRSLLLFLALSTICTGCVHRIHTNPLPNGPSAVTIPRSLQILVAPVSLEGADHRPGITLLEWPQRDVHQAVIQYLQQRGTFAAVSADRSDLTLNATTKLALSSHQNRYHYRVRLQAEMKEGDRMIKSYAIDQVVVGSSVRWTTASDRLPINTALQQALEELTNKIESDRLLYLHHMEQPLP